MVLVRLEMRSSKTLSLDLSATNVQLLEKLVWTQPTQNSRFYWITQCIEEVLYLARLLSDCIQRTWVRRGIIATWSAKRVLISKVITSCTPNLCHLGIACLSHRPG